MVQTLEELQETYDLELDRVISEIKSKKVKTVLLQFPDGLKPHATQIANYIEKNTEAKISIRLGDCFGACDTPETGAELIIQFGHAPWK
jgi:2-(3-amino-3-carboxypropyl)histidine synthase